MLSTRLICMERDEKRAPLKIPAWEVTTINSGGFFQKNSEGVCGTLPESVTLFQTKICDFPYPI